MIDELVDGKVTRARIPGDERIAVESEALFGCGESSAKFIVRPLFGDPVEHLPCFFPHNGMRLRDTTVWERPLVSIVFVVRIAQHLVEIVRKRHHERAQR